MSCEMGEKLVRGSHGAVGGEVLRPRDIARPGDVALLVERGRPHVDHHHVGIAAALKQPVGAGGAAVHRGRGELGGLDLGLLAAELAAVGSPLLDAAVEDAGPAVPEIVEHPEYPRRMKAALVVVENDVRALVDAAAAEKLRELVVEQPRALDLRRGIVDAVGRDIERSRDAAGLVILLRAHVDHAHVVAAEHVVECRGGHQQMRIGVVGGTGLGRCPAGDSDGGDPKHCHPRFHGMFLL